MVNDCDTALEQSIISGNYEVSSTDKSLVEEAKTRAKEYLSKIDRRTKEYRDKAAKLYGVDRRTKNGLKRRRNKARSSEEMVSSIAGNEVEVKGLNTVSRANRRKALDIYAPQYAIAKRQLDGVTKTNIIIEFCMVCGYGRNYGSRKLRQRLKKPT